MLEEGLLAGYKSVDPTPRARRRLDPAEGWEDWAQGQKLRPSHWPETIIEKEEEETGWFWVGYPKMDQQSAEGASGIGPAISTWDPARNLKKRLQRGDPGINRLDRIAKTARHRLLASQDLEGQAMWADRKMIRAIDHLPGRKSMTEHVVKKIMQAKTRLNL